MNEIFSPRRGTRALFTSVASLLSLVCGSGDGYGQGIPITGTMTYNQNFNSLGTGSVPWVNNSTLTGWYATIDDSLTPSGNLQPSNGSVDLNGLLNLGTTGSPDRAIGSKVTSTGNFANIAYGVLFRNTTALDRIRISSISYTGEQWRTNSGGVAERWYPSYYISNNPITFVLSGASSDTPFLGDYISLSGMEWTSPNNSPGGAQRDGNQAPNRTVITSSFATADVIIDPGQYCMIRWVDTNVAETDGHQGIDDLIVQFTRYRALVYNREHSAGGAPNGVLQVGGGNYWLDNSVATSLAVSEDVFFLQSGDANISVPANVTVGTLTSDFFDGTYTVGGAGRLSGRLQKFNTGTLVLTSPNSFSGFVILAGGGVLETRASGALGPNEVRLSGFSTLRTDGVAQTHTGNIQLELGGGTIETITDLTINGGLTGFGALVKSGPGVLTFSGTGTATGDIYINQGTLRVNNFAGIGTNAQGLRLNGGTLEIPSAGTVIYNDTSTVTRNLYADSEGTVAVPNTTPGNAVSIGRTDSIIGDGIITKTGGGTLRIIAPQTQFTGNWQVNGGFLEPQVANGLGTGTVILNAGGTLAPQNLTVPNTISLRGGALGTRSGDGTVYNGAVDVVSDSSVSLRSSISPTVANNVTIGGVLSGDGELTINGTTNPAAGNTRALILRNTDNTYEGNFVVTSQQNLLNQSAAGTGKTLGNSSVTLRGGSLQIRDNGTGNNGPLAYGNDILTGNPTDAFQPGISTLFVDRFSVNTGNTIVLGRLTMGDHTLAFTGANGYRASFSGGTFDGNAVLQTNNTTAPIFHGVYNGSGGFTKTGAGALEFAGTSSYTGATVVSGGTLTLTGSVATSSRVEVKTGAILNVAGVTAGFVVPVQQVLAGAGTVQGGVTVDGTLAPGDGPGTLGTLLFTTTVTLDGTAEFEIRKQGVVRTSDVAGVTGSLTLGGELNVTAVGDPLALGDTFDLFDAGSLLGNFTSINLPPLPDNLAWDTGALSTEGEITVVPEPGAIMLLMGGLGALAGFRRRRNE